MRSRTLLFLLLLVCVSLCVTPSALALSLSGAGGGLPTVSCTDTGGNHLNFSGGTWTCGTSSSGGAPGNAKADSLTKGIATFPSADFTDNGSGLIGLQLFSTYPTKTTPVGADTLLIGDSAAGGVRKATTIAALPYVSWPSAVVDQGGQVYNVKAYGAIGNGVADDAPAINAAIQALPSSGGIVFLPAGTYRLTTSINIQDTDAGNHRKGVRFVGSNAGSAGANMTTIVRWDAVGGNIFEVWSRENLFEFFTVDVASGKSAATAFNVDKTLN